MHVEILKNKHPSSAHNCSVLVIIVICSRLFSTCDLGYGHLIEFAHACGYYLRAATIQGAASIRIIVRLNTLQSNNLMTTTHLGFIQVS